MPIGTHSHIGGAQSMVALAESYNKSVQEEDVMTAAQLKTRHVGKKDPKRHLEETVETVMGRTISQTLGAMVNTVIF
jgi:26S proteasome regulatory subunit N11